MQVLILYFCSKNVLTQGQDSWEKAGKAMTELLSILEYLQSNILHWLFV